MLKRYFADKLWSFIVNNKTYIEPKKNNKVSNWVLDDRRYHPFMNALIMVNSEMVPGDILEFGVGNGRSLALLSLLQQRALYLGLIGDVCGNRKIVGFDTFTGLPDSGEHPRWEEGMFSKNYSGDNPLLKLDEKIELETIYKIFEECEVNKPDLIKGLYQITLSENIPKKYNKAALIHIDCDLYESTKSIFDVIEPTLQDGTIILFDDWFCYKGSPIKGEARAFNEFLEENPRWKAIQFSRYCAACNSFIMHDTMADKQDNKISTVDRVTANDR